MKGFQTFTDRRGKRRCYHRKSKEVVDLERFPEGSAGFIVECKRIEEGFKPPKPIPGTIGLLIEAYRESDHFSQLAPRTRKDYDKVFTYLKPMHGTALHEFDPPYVVQIMDKARQKGWRFANHVRTVLSLLFAWGIPRGIGDKNPASQVKSFRRPKHLPRANRPWSDRERHAVLDSSPAYFKPILALMMFTGVSPQDAAKMKRTAYKDGDITTNREKTGGDVWWPCPHQLKVILAEAPKHSAMTLCANSLGLQWTEHALVSAWERVRDRLLAEKKIDPGLTLYGLRHTVANILREIGFDERTIADALGQKTIEMARHYSTGADLQKKMKNVVKKFDKEVNERRSKASNSSPKVSNIDNYRNGVAKRKPE